MQAIPFSIPRHLKPDLYRAIPERCSCRAFGDELSLAEWGELSYALGRLERPGVRIALLRVPEGLFTGTLLGMGRVTGGRACAAVITEGSSREHILSAGFAGEQLVLTAHQMGLGSCWIGTGFRRRDLEDRLRPGECLQAVIVLGHPLSSVQPQRRRKPLEKLCENDPALWPEELRAMAEAVRLAPSDMNSQPWQMRLEKDRFTLRFPEKALLEAGIALCHAECAAIQPHQWHISIGREILVWLTQEEP